MRVNFISKSGQAQALAMAISREYQCKSDSIPPAYPCENEKLVFIGFEFGSCEKVVNTFCKTLTPERAKNVAFFATSSSGDKIPLTPLSAYWRAMVSMWYLKTSSSRLKADCSARGKFPLRTRRPQWTGLKKLSTLWPTSRLANYKNPPAAWDASSRRVLHRSAFHKSAGPGQRQLFPAKSSSALIPVNPSILRGKRSGLPQRVQQRRSLPMYKPVTLGQTVLARTPCRKNIHPAHFPCGNASLDLPVPLQIGIARRITPAQSHIP